MIPKQVRDLWGIRGQAIPFGSGHINDTFLVGNSVIVQRVNSHVFKRPVMLMENFDRVADLIRDLVVSPLTTQTHQRWWFDGTGDLWRVYPYVASRSFEYLPDELVKPVGAAFGRLARRLRSADVEVQPSIASFHDISQYLLTLDQLRTTNIADEELAFVDARRDAVPDFSRDRQVIHGDCKVNNALIACDEPRVVAIVDLDTLMTGHAAWDYGDLVRSVCTQQAPAATAEADVDQRIADVTRAFFQAFAPENAEIACFAAAPSHMSFMLGVRFLADHFDGDRYFRVGKRGENLLRAREQFRLAELFGAKAGFLADAIGCSLS